MRLRLSRRSSFQQLIQGDKAQPVVHDVDVLYGKDALHHIGGNLVNLPAAWIFRILQIAVWNVGCQRNTALTLRLFDSADFASGISRIKLVSQPRIKNDALCFDISDKIVVDVNILLLVIVHGIVFGYAPRWRSALSPKAAFSASHGCSAPISPCTECLS